MTSEFSVKTAGHRRQRHRFTLDKDKRTSVGPCDARVSSYNQGFRKLKQDMN